MGAYTCEFGVVHKVCRCPAPHTIKCDKPVEHGGTLYQAGTSSTHAPCYRMAKGLLGKHESHLSHEFWFTSYGGGHYMDEYDPSEKDCRKWICPGKD